MRPTVSAPSIVSLAVGMVVAASIIGSVAYVSSPARGEVDAARVASANLRTSFEAGSSADDPRRMLQQWLPRPVPKPRLRTAPDSTAPQPPAIPLVQVAKPAAQAAALSSADVQPKPQVEAAPKHDGGDDTNLNSDGESQGLDD